MIAVWFSCGAASAAALKLALDIFGKDRVRAINQPIAEEDADNRRFLHDVEEWLGVEVEQFTASKYPTGSAVDVWEKRKAMSFPNGAPCTVHLKKEARQEWETINSPAWHVLGFTHEEQRRHDRFALTERANSLPLLIEARMDKASCGDMIRAAGITLPRIYSIGFPNANCIGCVKATSPTYWNLVREKFPDDFAARSEQSRRLGARLVRVNNKRIFLDELDPDATGRPLWSMPECGLFCEEPET